MSAHELYDLADGIALVVAGWNPAFGSFYVTVYEQGDGWPCPTIELGDDRTPITRAEWVIDILDGYATPPADFAETLQADAEKEGVCDIEATLATAPPLSSIYQLDDADIPF